MKALILQETIFQQRMEPLHTAPMCLKQNTNYSIAVVLSSTAQQR